MPRVAGYSVLLIVGLVLSQHLPATIGPAYDAARHWIDFLALVALAFIMIRVGHTFDFDPTKPGKYAWDYIVAGTAAGLPWLFVALYFLYILGPAGAPASGQAWREALLAARFAAPTSAGVLFSMLAAAGLTGTWLFKKARILAIFDDVDTVLLIIPLRILLVGFAWQFGFIVALMVVLLYLAWNYLHAWNIRTSWSWLLGYSILIAGSCKIVYVTSRLIDPSVPIHVEVLLPAFILGCVTRQARAEPSPADEKASGVISAVFMLLVGLSMPEILTGPGDPGWGLIALHVAVVTILSNLGKMFPLFCYRREAGWRARLALCIGMWPRGEVGAGVLAISLSYGITGPMITVAMLSLALNLLLTGAYVWLVKKTLDAKNRGLTSNV